MLLQRLAMISEQLLHSDCEMNATLDIEAVRMIEYLHGISLAEDYVLFLTQIGNGGEGRCGSLFAICRALAEHEVGAEFMCDEPIICGENGSREYEEFRKSVVMLYEDENHLYAMPAKGEYRGSVWQVTKGDCAVCGGMLYSPETDEPMGFSDWYNRYIDIDKMDEAIMQAI